MILLDSVNKQSDENDSDPIVFVIWNSHLSKGKDKFAFINYIHRDSTLALCKVIGHLQKDG